MAHRLGQLVVRYNGMTRKVFPYMVGSGSLLGSLCGLGLGIQQPPFHKNGQEYARWILKYTWWGTVMGGATGGAITLLPYALVLYTPFAIGDAIHEAKKGSATKSLQ